MYMYCAILNDPTTNLLCVTAVGATRANRINIVCERIAISCWSDNPSITRVRKLYISSLSRHVSSKVYMHSYADYKFKIIVLGSKYYIYKNKKSTFRIS